MMEVEMSAAEYTLKVHDEGDHIWAEVVELPGCFASGANMDELREALEEAMAMYLSDEPGQYSVTITSLEPQRITRRAHVRAQLVAA
jgi:predicted RNase H-like HicB family nuclease